MTPPRSQRCEDDTRVMAQKIAPGADNGIYTERSKKLQTQGKQSVAADAAQQCEQTTREQKQKKERGEKRETKLKGERPKDPSPFSENREEENRTIRSRKPEN